MIATDEKMDLIRDYYDKKEKKHMMRKERRKSCDSGECSSLNTHILIAIFLLLLGIIPGIIYITIKSTEYGLVVPTSDTEEIEE